MRKYYALLLACTFFLKNYSQSPKVYINLNSHNEVSGVTEPNYSAIGGTVYANTYTYIKQIADSVISKKVKYNFQSDVNFLLACLTYDPKTTATSGFNILKWMDNSPYIECDPHCHEQTYQGKQWNYADCAHLHDSLGVTNRRNVGGFKVDGLQNGNYWLNMEAGIPGKRYSTAAIWKPYTLWGGSYKTGVHNDMNTFGEWKPQDSINYGTHVNTRRLALQGNGCEMHFTDTTDEQRIIKELRKICVFVNSGVYPAGQYYTQSIQFDCRDVSKTNFVTRLCKILDSVNVYVGKGWADWKTITEKDLIWRTFPLDSSYLRKDCSALPSGIRENIFGNSYKFYPNPSSGTVNLLISDAEESVFSLMIMDVNGRTVHEQNVMQASLIDVSKLNNGVYYLCLQDKNGRRAFEKLILAR